MPRGRKRVPMRNPGEAWELAAANSGLVYSVLFRFVNGHNNLVWYKGEDLQAELESYAWEGLYEACLLWDETKGTLATYAYPAIKNSLLKALDKLMKMGGTQKGGGQIQLKYPVTPPVFSLDAIAEQQQAEQDQPGTATTIMDTTPQPWDEAIPDEETLINRLDAERGVKKVLELVEKMPEPHRSVFKVMALSPRQDWENGQNFRDATMRLREGGKRLHYSDDKIKKLYEESLEWMEYQLIAANYGRIENDG